jgi:4a-hydroxytetrahydrobiopterin dehydratase
VIPLSTEEIHEELSKLDGWSFENMTLVKQYEFGDFAQAMGFINKLAKVAERMNHHPEWTNSYNKVLLKLSTHSAGGVTQKDIAMAQSAEQAAKAHST